MSALMESLADEDDEDAAETEQELDLRMKQFEELMDRRPFLVNDVLLRRNPNDVQEWEKRVALWGEDDEKVWLLMKILSYQSTVSLGCRDVYQSSGDYCASKSNSQSSPPLYQLLTLLRRRWHCWPG
jgi:hypothetical protein